MQHVGRDARRSHSWPGCHPNSCPRLWHHRLDVDHHSMFLSHRPRGSSQIADRHGRRADLPERRWTYGRDSDVVLCHLDSILHRVLGHVGRHANGLRICPRRRAPILKVCIPKIPTSMQKVNLTYSSAAVSSAPSTPSPIRPSTPSGWSCSSACV